MAYQLIHVLFTLATVTLTIYSLHLYVMLALFFWTQKKRRQEQKQVIENFLHKKRRSVWPTVTTQIPLYNEKDVVARIMRAVAAMDYPTEKHEIQILDDSTDETRAIVDAEAERLRHLGHDIRVIRRSNRTGYKAGALAEGLRRTKCEYVLILDADFVPPADFLARAVALIDQDPSLACVQGRWEHLNRDESWLTRTQAFCIDAHFGIEQGARAWSGLMLHFNGTGGIWRRAAIEDRAVGGWSADTLTEDIDLSYRVQLAGWRIDYCLDLACPAELPADVHALKTQQRRWATGSIQVAVKLLPSIWRSPNSLARKIEATIHLTYYSAACWVLILALLANSTLTASAPVTTLSSWMWLPWLLLQIVTPAPILACLIAHALLRQRWAGILLVPNLILLGAGLSVNNALGVFRGLSGRAGEFVRTPKSGSTGIRLSGSYRAATSHMYWGELAMGIYCAVIMGRDLAARGATGFAFSMFISAVGFLMMAWLSRPRRMPNGMIVESTALAPAPTTLVADRSRENVAAARLAPAPAVHPSMGTSA